MHGGKRLTKNTLETKNSRHGLPHIGEESAGRKMARPKNIRRKPADEKMFLVPGGVGWGAVAYLEWSIQIFGDGEIWRYFKPPLKIP